MSNKLTAVVYSVGDTQQISDKFSKRDLVLLDESGKYPQHISVQFTQDKCDLLDNFGEGQEVEVAYNLRGRLWLNPKTNVEQCFNTLEGWKIEAVGGSTPTPVAQPVAEPVAEDGDSESGDDLPF